MVTLSVVIPATDSPSTLDRCRSALRASSEQPLEVIVVDGPSSLSASGARNRGVAQARGDIVVFVDADVEVHPDALARLRSSLAADAELAAVFGSYDDAPADESTVSAFRNLLHHHVHHDAAGPADTFWTGLGAVRRRAFLDVGGFDEERFPHPSIEDIELGGRLRAAGYRIELDPHVQGTHLKSWTLRSMVVTDFARRGVPWVAHEVRNRSISGSLNLGWRHRLSALVCIGATAALLTGRTRALALAGGTLVALNASFYALLERRLGWRGAVAGIGLHALHHLVAVAAVPVGVIAGLRDPRRSVAATPVVPAVGAA